jgi:hypothetical protein
MSPRIGAKRELRERAAALGATVTEAESFWPYQMIEVDAPAGKVFAHGHHWARAEYVPDRKGDLREAVDALLADMAELDDCNNPECEDEDCPMGIANLGGAS